MTCEDSGRPLRKPIKTDTDLKVVFAVSSSKIESIESHIRQVIISIPGGPSACSHTDVRDGFKINNCHFHLRNKSKQAGN